MAGAYTRLNPVLNSFLSLRAGRGTLTLRRRHTGFKGEPPLQAPGVSVKGQDVLDEFRDAGALMEGHFILSSGLRSPVFLQKMRIFEDPVRTERVCSALGALIRESFGQVDLVVSPAIGGIIPGYETARALGCNAVFVERENGEFALRRGFEIHPGQRIVIVEDLVTTGLSSRECIAAIRQHPGELVGAACIVDRSGGKADLGIPLVSLCQLDIPAYPADALPPELAAIPAVKPGSRALA
jgi:orotate phosphoribosyltransferase